MRPYNCRRPHEQIDLVITLSALVIAAMPAQVTTGGRVLSIRNGSVIQTGGLASSSKGARLRVVGGKLTVTDGPFTEAKEVVGGYAVLEANSREEALESARIFMRLHQQHWPAWEGECEIREVVFLAP